MKESVLSLKEKNKHITLQTTMNY